MPNKKSIDVILINPPSYKGQGERGDFFTPPIGLSYLASSLQKNNFTVDIIDCNPENIYIDYHNPTKEQEQKLLNIFLKFNIPLIIGIGPITTPFLRSTLSLARFIKNKFPKSYLLLGGPHTSIKPPEMAIKMLKKFPFIDGICINEGEETIVELISKLKYNIIDDSITGLVYKYNGEYLFKNRELISSAKLDSMPFPNRSLFNKYTNKYKLALRRNFFKILSNPKLIKKYGENPNFTVIFGSRGCPYRCNYCCSLPYRRLRSVQNIFQEIIECIDKYKINCFIFYDDLFTTSTRSELKRIEELCNLILSNNIEIFWEVELRADIICKIGSKILNLMNRAGCSTVNIGIEKFENSALNWLQKDLSNDQIIGAVKTLKESGDFIINGTFILGGLNETEQDVLNIIRFSKDLKIDFSAFYPLEIHPGTVLFDIAKELSIVDDLLDDYINESNNYPLFVTEQLNREKLFDLQCVAYQQFYFDPNYIKLLINKLNSISLTYRIYEHFFEHAFLRGIR